MGPAIGPSGATFFQADGSLECTGLAAETAVGFECDP
jgi:hypothetical protein